MQITHASVPAPKGTNEDEFRFGDNWAMVIDGAGRYPNRTGGCVHPVTWIVEHLADHASSQLCGSPDVSLIDVAREAIRATMADHTSCDLTDPLTPGAAIAVLRTQADLVEWLVLGDCAVALDRIGADPIVVIDDRVDRLPDAPITDAAIRTWDPDYVARVRNQPGGFWVAAATPEAAEQAIVGSIDRSDVKQALICSDGVSRLTERHGWSWHDMFEIAREKGPGALIKAVRKADSADPDPRRWRGKPHDDATAALIQFVTQGG